MPHFCQSVCPTEPDACAAFPATDGLFDGIDEITGYGRKRYAESILWRFDDDPQDFERVVEALRQTGLFTEVREISEECFWRSRSYAV